MAPLWIKQVLKPIDAELYNLHEAHWLWSSIYRQMLTLCHSDKSSSLEGSIELKNSISDFGLIDSFRYLNPQTKHYTWFGHQATKASWLDRVFVPPKLIENTFAEFFPYADHKFVHCFLAIETNASNHGNSYFKLINSILSARLKFHKLIIQYKKKAKNMADLWHFRGT